MTAAVRARGDNGWALNLLDMVWAEYGWTREAGLSCPLATLFVAYRQRCRANGNKHMISLVEQETLAQTRKVLEEITHVKARI
jgi:hypothetical protein